jgi:TBC1 domain family member 4
LAAKKAIKDEMEHQNLSDTSIVQNDLKIILTKESDASGEQSDSSSLSGDVKLENPTMDKMREIIRSNSIEPPQRNRSASIGCVEQNRTMVFILGRSDIRLISPDRKQVLLHKNFVDLVTVVQGVENSDHFGIICMETKENKCEYIGYVFKCQSGSIAHDIMTSVTKSLETLRQTKQQEEIEKNLSSEPLTCDHCPMVWYNRLCATVEGLNDKKTYNTIMRFTEELNEEDHEIIMQKFFGSDKVNDFSLRERNKFLIALIEAHCQFLQQRHVHDTIENRSEFLTRNLGGSTIFMKAKRSLTSSFDHLLKRRGSKDFIDSNNNNNFHDPDDLKRIKQVRSMSLAPNSPQTLTLKMQQRESPERQQVNTSKMDM